jgi:hypothetical protein
LFVKNPVIWKHCTAMKLILRAIPLVLSAVSGSLGIAHAQSLDPAEARAIAKEAYIYGFPLVDHYRIQYTFFQDAGNPEFKAPWNHLKNTARVFTPDDTTIQTPNSDTPYSHMGADLRTEPLVLTFPKIDGKRYYSAQFVDAYTHNFAYVGNRTYGSDGGSYLLAGPEWKGEKPAGIKDVIRCETGFAFVQYRTQLFDSADIEEVKKIQQGYQVQPLSAFLKQDAPPAAPKLDFIKPLSPDEQKTSPKFFEIVNFVLGYCPVHPSEKELMARFAKLGLGASGSYKADHLTPEIAQAVQDGMADAWKEFAENKAANVDTGKVSAADGFGTREFLKNNYLFRMTSAALGIYGNTAEEALYPAYYVDADKAKLDGSKRYTLRFGPGQLPPANSFWSFTLYDLPASLLVRNPLNRFLINSTMLDAMKRDADGGLTLYIQHESPGGEKEANWLPAPAGPFWGVIRIYWPKPEALDGRWQAPKLQPVK